MSRIELIIGNQNYSSWSLRPWLFLQHHGIEFELTKVALFSPQMEQELESFYSNNKVPVLKSDGEIIWDSLAILEFLAESYPELQGWPSDARARAVARSACAEMHSSFMDLRNELPMNCRRLFRSFKLSAATQHDVDRILSLWRYCRKHFASAGPWLFGEFSVADCMYAPVVLRLRGYDVQLDPVSAAYVKTVTDSPALQAWLAAARDEPEVIVQAEIDWPSESN